LHRGKALRAVVATALLGLTLAPAASADTSTLDLVLARDDCAGEAPPNLRLDFGPGAASGSCAQTASWYEPTKQSFPAKAGMPMTVDGTRHALVTITVNSYAGRAVGGLGDQTTSVELQGVTTTGARVVMARGTQTIGAADMLRTPTYVAEFDLPVVGGTYKSMTLNLTIGGSALHGFVHYNGDSFVSMPVADTP
jgi:hypothetical protein